jgi:5-methylcytosine-specific restriction endonuclease McrA
VKIADIVRERDGNCCITCGRPAGEVHHVVKRGHRLVCKDIGEPMNLVIKCSECHAKAHNQAARYRDLQYLITHYGKELYQEHDFDYWREVLRRGEDG